MWLKTTKNFGKMEESVHSGFLEGKLHKSFFSKKGNETDLIEKNKSWKICELEILIQVLQFEKILHRILNFF
jgi:hypothetical protein